MSFVSSYLFNLAKRAVTDGPVHPVEIAKLPDIIDKYYGDGDGQLEISDLVDCGTELVSNVVDKAEAVISFVAELFQ